MGLPWWLSGKESACQCRGRRVQSLVREDPTYSQTAKPTCLQAIEPISATGEATAMRQKPAQQQRASSAESQDCLTPTPSPSWVFPQIWALGALCLDGTGPRRVYEAAWFLQGQQMGGPSLWKNLDPRVPADGCLFFFLIFIYLCINLAVSYCVQDLFVMAC